MQRVIESGETWRVSTIGPTKEFSSCWRACAQIPMVYNHVYFLFKLPIFGHSQSSDTPMCFIYICSPVSANGRRIFNFRWLLRWPPNGWVTLQCRIAIMSTRDQRTSGLLIIVDIPCKYQKTSQFGRNHLIQINPGNYSNNRGFTYVPGCFELGTFEASMRRRRRPALVPAFAVSKHLSTHWMILLHIFTWCVFKKLWVRGVVVPIVVVRKLALG